MINDNSPISRQMDKLLSKTKKEAPTGDLWQRLKFPLSVCGIVGLLFLGGFGAWSSAVPLAGGAVAPGVISPMGARKTVQHLEGGIVEEILARDGDQVQVGDPLIILARTQALMSYEVYLSQLRTLEASLARLQAELAGEPEITFPQWAALADEDLEIEKLLRFQTMMFETRLTSHQSRKDIQRQQVAQLQEEIVGLENQIEMQVEEIAFIEDELVGVIELYKKGYGTKPRKLALQKNKAEIAGEKAANVAAIARARQNIQEIELQIVTMDMERRNEVVEEINKTIAEIASIREQFLASEDVLQRTTITAPVSGTVVNAQFKTKGGVIRPGEPVLDIVPLDDDLIIEARVAPLDVDVVNPGLIAQVTLSAFQQRNLPLLSGRVQSISADAIVDEGSSETYYKAIVRVDRDHLSEIEQDTGLPLTLKPGMPAEVLIVTGHRTFVSYLFKPLTSSFRKSFREE